jgi:hypothetical protein
MAEPKFTAKYNYTAYAVYIPLFLPVTGLSFILCQIRVILFPFHKSVFSPFRYTLVHFAGAVSQHKFRAYISFIDGRFKAASCKTWGLKFGIFQFCVVTIFIH